MNVDTFQMVINWNEEKQLRWSIQVYGLTGDPLLLKLKEILLKLKLF